MAHGGSPATGDGGGGGGGGIQGAFTSRLEPARITVRAATATTVKARLTRSGWAWAVSLFTASGLPTGVTFSAPTLWKAAPREKSRSRQKQGPRVVSSKPPITAEAVDRSFSRTEKLEIDVRGTSGQLDTTFGVNGIARGPFAGTRVRPTRWRSTPPAASSTAATRRSRPRSRSAEWRGSRPKGRLTRTSREARRRSRVLGG